MMRCCIGGNKLNWNETETEFANFINWIECLQSNLIQLQFSQLIPFSLPPCQLRFNAGCFIKWNCCWRLISLLPCAKTSAMKFNPTIP